MGKIVIELCSNCNGTCDVCQRYVDPDMKNFLNKNIDFDDLISFLERQNQENYVLQLSGIIGDPFLYNKLIPFLEYLEENSRFKEVRFHTNFSFNNNNALDIMKRLLEKNILQLWVGIESLNPEIHHIYRGTPLKQILKNLEYLEYKGPNIIIRPIIFGHNENDLPALKKYSEDNNFTFMAIRSSLYTDTLKEPVNTEIFEESLYSKRYCEYCETNFMILVTGTVVPCCYAVSNLRPTNSIKDYILLGKNLKKLNIKNVGDIETLHDNEYFKLYHRREAAMCDKCMIIDKYKPRDL